MTLTLNFNMRHIPLTEALSLKHRYEPAGAIARKHCEDMLPELAEFIKITVPCECARFGPGVCKRCKLLSRAEFVTLK